MGGATHHYAFVTNSDGQKYQIFVNCENYNFVQQIVEIPYLTWWSIVFLSSNAMQ